MSRTTVVPTTCPHCRKPEQYQAERDLPRKILLICGHCLEEYTAMFTVKRIDVEVTTQKGRA